MFRADDQLSAPYRETPTQADIDAEFIAHAREDIPWLLDQLRAAHEENATLTKQLEESSAYGIKAESELRAARIAELESALQARASSGGTADGKGEPMFDGQRHAARESEAFYQAVASSPWAQTPGADAIDARRCTCPSEEAPWPCQKLYALSECLTASAQPPASAPSVATEPQCTGPFSDAFDCPIHDPRKRLAPTVATTGPDELFDIESRHDWPRVLRRIAQVIGSGRYCEVQYIEGESSLVSPWTPQENRRIARILNTTAAEYNHLDELRRLFTAGIRVAMSYCDNSHHLEGDQLERQFQRALIVTTPPDAPTRG
jgi:hypothetical protein